MTINFPEYICDARRLWVGEAMPSPPLVLIDLDRTGEWPDEVTLPPCPVVGFGDAAHPLAARLDVVVEAPVSVAGVVRGVLAAPVAAGVVVQCLRILPEMTVEAGLVAESMAYGLLQGGAEHRAWLAGRGPLHHPADGVGEDFELGRVLAERHDDVLEVTFDRAEAGNAVDVAMRDALRELFAAAALDETIARIHLRGAGRSFCLGAELAEFGTMRDGAMAHSVRQLTLPAPMIARVAARMTAHIQGACVGAGLEMAAFAAWVTAERGAWFQLPELAMGLIPGAGGCVSVSRRIGRQRTALMVLSGRRISAEVALGWGLIDAISSDETGADEG
jgi:enoyl-CoA hydratase/carnithine racemase